MSSTKMKASLGLMQKAEDGWKDRRTTGDQVQDPDNPDKLIDPAKRRRGLKLDRIALWMFIVVEGLYFVISVYALAVLGMDFEEQTDFTGSMAGTSSNSNGATRRAEVYSGGTVDISGGTIEMPPFNSKTRYMFIYTTGTCLIMNFILIFFMARLAGLFVWLGPAFLMVYLAIGTGLGIWKQSWLIAGVWGAFLVIVPVMIYFMRKRFELGKYLLETAGQLAKENPSVFGVTITALFVQFFFGMINVFSLIAIFLRFQPQHKACEEGAYCSWMLVVVLCIFGLLAHLWLSSVIANIVLTALAGGPFSTHYFYPNKEGDRGTWRAVRVVWQKSLGTICFGSLFVGIVHLLNGILSGLMGPSNPNDTGVGCYIVLMVLRFILAYPLSILDWLLQHFNKYVYIFVAIGKRDDVDKEKLIIEPFEETYIEAGMHCARFVMRHPKKPKELVEAEKKSMNKRSVSPEIKERMRQLAQSHGISTLVNNDITGMALACACISTAVFCMVFTWVYMYFVNDTVIADHWYDWAVLFYSFILGLTIGLVLTSALEVGVSTLFVCMSENINCLQRLNPDFFEFISKEYPFMFEALQKKESKMGV